MKKKIAFGVLSAVLAINSAVGMAEEGGADSQLQGKKIVVKCKAAGSEMASLGQVQVDSEADIKFDLKVRGDGVRVIEKLKGKIVLDSSKTVSDSLTALFRDEQAIENVDYHPRVYKGYSQFKNIDALASGDQQGLNMVGVLLLEKDLTKEHVRAVYQFAAGDSMGGVLHLSCETRVGD